MDMDKSKENIKVFYLSLREDTPKKGFWDYGFISDLLKNFESEEVNKIPDNIKNAIVVLPARSHKDYVDQLNIELNKLDGVVLMLMGDEESVFPVEKINHRNIKIWVQNPTPNKHDAYRKLGTGYAPHTHEFKPESNSKDLSWFFAGQVTHQRRLECVEQLRQLNNGELVESKGFTQGLDPKDYVEKMSKAKICPCPSGPETPDTFRLYEALELGCIPIADTQTPKEDWAGFWEWLFEEEVPFPTIVYWDSVKGYIDDIEPTCPCYNNKIQAWWFRYKNKVKNWLISDIFSIGGYCEKPLITAVIPVSPIPSHPDISILVETIESIRFHHPNIPIVVTFDGVRLEQIEKSDLYCEHIRRFLWKYGNDFNIIPYIYHDHMHQSGMARDIIDKITTPLVLYVEQDTPLVKDEPINWEKVENLILSGESNLVRFHFEAQIPKEHEYLMIGEVENGFRKTIQWSQRPHLASTAFYKRIISDYFTDTSRCFIEDKMHGKVLENTLNDKTAWYQWRLHIYHPDGQIKRSYHTDGRAGNKKFDESQVW